MSYAIVLDLSQVDGSFPMVLSYSTETPELQWVRTDRLVSDGLCDGWRPVVLDTLDLACAAVLSFEYFGDDVPPEWVSIVHWPTCFRVAP